MEKIKLGSSDAFISIICLGAMFFGTKTIKEMSFKIMDEYLENGGSFIDTSNMYASWVPGFKGGESEDVIGQWFKLRKNRDKVFIATKVGFSNPTDKIEAGLSEKQIKRACELSLRRLSIDTIDLYYAHVDDRKTPMDESLEAFNDLVKDGKVRYIGASNFPVWRLQKANLLSEFKNYTGYCCMQTRYTYLLPRPGSSFTPQLSANDDLIDYCNSSNIRMLAYSPLLQGAYDRSDKPFPNQYFGSDNEIRLKILQDVAKEHNATNNQIVLAWLINKKYPVIPVIGVSNLEQLKDNLISLKIILSDEQFNRLNKAHSELPEY